MGPSLADLPVDLYFSIVSQIDADDLQHSLLSLSRALPHAPLPIYLLFERVRITQRKQIYLLYKRLRNAPEDAARVRVLLMESWTADADIFVNLMALLPSVKHLGLYIGPDFSPEHLEEIFEQRRENLQFISLRFRPYVDRATYYQFLAGLYFDSMLDQLSHWPPHNLPTISIVQDPPDPTKEARGNFAQPLVFHSLLPLTDFAVSPVCEGTKHLRLRVPSPRVCQQLHRKPNPFPSLEFLDMSTSNVTAGDVVSLVGSLSRVEILVLDGCPIVSQRTDIQVDAGNPFQQWMDLGRALALVGVERAREREKTLRTWLEHYHTHAHEDAAHAEPARKPRRGRRGLATAAFSLRAPSPERMTQRGVTIPRHRIPLVGSKVRVLPSPPTLRSLATSLPGGVTPETYEAIKRNFEQGWAAGIATLSSKRLQLQTTFRNGNARVVRFADKGTPEWEEERLFKGQGLAGLTDVVQGEEFALNVAHDDEDAPEGGGSRGHECPLLCLAGPARDAAHVEGCGHRVGWDIYKDDI